MVLINLYYLFQKMVMKRSSYLDYRVTRGGKGIIGIINSPEMEIFPHL